MEIGHVAAALRWRTNLRNFKRLEAAVSECAIREASSLLLSRPDQLLECNLPAIMSVVREVARMHGLDPERLPHEQQVVDALAAEALACHGMSAKDRDRVHRHVQGLERRSPTGELRRRSDRTIEGAFLRKLQKHRPGFGISVVTAVVVVLSPFVPVYVAAMAAGWALAAWLLLLEYLSPKMPTVRSSGTTASAETAGPTGVSQTEEETGEPGIDLRDGAPAVEGPDVSGVGSGETRPT